MNREEQVSLQNAMLATIVESSDDAILGINRHGTILFWNTGAEQLYGFAAEEVIGKHISLLVPVDNEAEEKATLDRVITGERISHWETVWMRKDGGRLLISLTMSPVSDAAGEVIGATAVTRDLTEIRRARSAQVLADHLEGQRQQALELNDAVLQGLVLAKLSLETGDGEGALEAVERSLAAARRIIGELIQDASGEDDLSLFMRDAPVWNDREPTASSKDPAGG